MHDFESDLTPGESEAIRNALGDEEYVLANYAPDLNLQSQFESNRVVLTNRRFLYRTNQEPWNEVEITPEHELICSELAGVQTIELRNSTGVSAVWRSTLSQVKSANRLRQTFSEWKLRTVDRNVAQGRLERSSAASFIARCFGY